MTTSPFKHPELISVFSLILIVLWSRGSCCFLNRQSHIFSSKSLWTVPTIPSFSYFIHFFALWEDPNICLSFHFLLFLLWYNYHFSPLRVFHWRLSDSKSPQVSRTLLSILADLVAVLWIVSIRPFISKSSCPFVNPLVSIPRAPITFHVTFMFLGFPSHLGQQSPPFNKFSFSFFFFFFLLTIIRYGRLAESKWSVCISKSERSLCVSFSWRDSGLCINYLFVWSNFNFLHNSQWITLPTQAFLVFYSPCASLLNSLLLLLLLLLSNMSSHEIAWEKDQLRH